MEKEEEEYDEGEEGMSKARIPVAGGVFSCVYTVQLEILISCRPHVDVLPLRATIQLKATRRHDGLMCYDTATWFKTEQKGKMIYA